MAQAVSDQVVDSEGKPFVLTFTKGIPSSASEVFLFLLDDGSIHEGVIDYTSTTFPKVPSAQLILSVGFTKNLRYHCVGSLAMPLLALNTTPASGRCGSKQTT